ncbi:VanZ family protein [Myxococcota bacterium]|nr:VanZ family protein [Myxococcota bacterium]
MKPWPHGALVVYLVALAFGVLTPHPPPGPLDPDAVARPPDGLVADAIRNLVLLMPLGWLLAALGRGARFAALLGFLLSLTIESAQALLPGRYPSAVDVVTNSLSAAAGALLYATRRSWLLPAPAEAARFALGCSVAATMGLVAGVQLLRLAPGEPGFAAGWRPELGQYELYSGAILGARIGDLALPIGPVVETEAFEDALAAGLPLVLEAELRPSDGATAPLFTVHDRDQDEVLLVAAQGADLLFEERTRALDLGLDQPAHRWANVLGPTPRTGRDAKSPPQTQSPSSSSQNAPTEVARIRIERSASSASLSLDGRPLGRRDWPPGRVWGLLIPGRIVPAGLEALLDGLAIALLALPCAYYARRTASIALLFAGLLVALPLLGPVSLPRAPEWLGLVAGLALAGIARVVCPKIVVLTPQDRSPDSFDEEPR